MTKATWLITGCGTGIGRALAHAVLASGGRALVTDPNLEALREFADRYPQTAVIQQLDVTRNEQIDAAVHQMEVSFGGVDVLVNNAGVGYLGAVEETPPNEAQRIFDINFFGLTNMIRAVLPGMRARRKGAIVNITSIGGLIGVVGAGYYCASKFAVEGLSETLALELKPLGIKVMAVEPTGFRTGLGARAGVAKNPIDDYDTTVGVYRRAHRAAATSEPGDPALAAEAIIRAIQSDASPSHLLLGPAAYKRASSKLENLQVEFDTWKAVTENTTFPT